MDIDEILKSVSAIIAHELGSSYRLFLFGSRAKGRYDEKSDIDIGIISDTRITGKQMATIQDKIEEIPTLLKIDLVDFNQVDDDFKKIALKHTRDIHK